MTYVLIIAASLQTIHAVSYLLQRVHKVTDVVISMQETRLKCGLTEFVWNKVRTARLPDRTPCDFYLCNSLKAKVYKMDHCMEGQLMQNIQGIIL
jgi:hypothetical protein